MSKGQSNQKRLRELDLLKSILDTDPGTDTGFVSSSLSNSRASSKMGDYSSQPEDHVRLTLPTNRGRPKSGKKKTVHRKASDEVMRVDVNVRKGSDYHEYQELSRLDTIHLDNGINYTPLIKRSPRSPRRVTSTKVPSTRPKPRRVDPLLSKYAELQEILSADVPGSTKGPVLDPYLTRKAQHLMLEHKLAQSGQMPVAWLNARGVSLPNIGRVKGKKRKSKFGTALHAGRQTLNFGSQTLPTENGHDDEDEDESYVLIDATNTNQVKTRKVTFANPKPNGDAESVYSNADSDVAEIDKQYRGILRGRPFSAPTYKSRSLVKKKPRILSGRPSQRNASNPKRAVLSKPKKFLEEKTPPSKFPKGEKTSRSSSRSSSRDRSKNKSKSRSSSRDSYSRSSSRSRSRSRSKSRSRSRSGSRSSFSSSSSRSSKSRSRSRSPRAKLDHKLVDTDNVKIKEWLKEKNKEHRKLQRQKRKETRKKLKEKQEEEERRQQKHEKSEIVVKKWIESKKREALLLKKKNREERTKANQSFDTVSSQDTYKQNDKATVDLSSNHNGRRPRDRARSARIRSQPSNLNKSKTNTKLKQDSESKEDTSEGKNEEEEKKRLSYDEWVAAKRKQDQESMKKAMKMREEQLRNSDPDMDSIISKVGENRINRIKSDKKRIDTGVERIDEKANLGFGETEQESKDQSDSKPRYQLNDNGDKPKQGKKPVKKKVKGAKGPLPVKRGTSPPLLTQPPVPPATPKPQVQSERKQKVKYRQRSWDQFSDYVWEKLNETDGDMERPEPQGSDQPDQRQRGESSESGSTSSKQSEESDELGKEEEKAQSTGSEDTNDEKIQSNEILGNASKFDTLDEEEVRNSNRTLNEDNTPTAENLDETVQAANSTQELSLREDELRELQCAEENSEESGGDTEEEGTKGERMTETVSKQIDLQAHQDENKRDSENYGTGNNDGGRDSEGDCRDREVDQANDSKSNESDEMKIESSTVYHKFDAMEERKDVTLDIIREDQEEGPGDTQQSNENGDEREVSETTQGTFLTET